MSKAAMSALIELEDSVTVLLQLQAQAKKDGKAAIKARYMAAMERRNIALERARKVIKASGLVTERESFAARQEHEKQRKRAV